MRLQNKPTELHSNLGLRCSCSFHYNQNQIYPLQLVLRFSKKCLLLTLLIAHYFSSSLFLHLPFSSEKSLERKHPQSGRSENLIYYVQLPANTETLDLTKGRKIVTHVFTA